MKTSPWIVVHDCCACRTIEGGDPDNVAHRIAFIEKSPRVRIGPPAIPFDLLKDSDNWYYGPKGSDGFDPDNREWCDEQLVKMGYELG
jgi:hypothetical protein